MRVACLDAEAFLSGGSEEIDAIITSPPYAGLEGRGAHTDGLVYLLLDAAKERLAPDGNIFLVVGASEGHLTTPHAIASTIPHLDGWRLAGVYVWDRSARLRRPVGKQTITNDFVLHVCRSGHDAEPIVDGSIIRTATHPFDYGFGVTMPPDLAALLVSRGSKEGDLVVDPFAGLGEVGVQAVSQGRLFTGCDIDEACVRIANARILAVSS